MVNVIWLNGTKGNWDSGLLSQIFDSRPAIFEQHNDKINKVFNRAIVIIVGKPDVSQTRAYLEKFKSGLAILTSNEDADFDYKKAIPAHFETWTQYYSPNRSEIETRILLGCPTRIKDFQTSPMEKKYLWSFVGQVQNTHREKCVEVLRKLPDGYLHIAKGFAGTLGDEVEYQNYLDIMRQSKFVICPSGSMCADSFRVYEAMECNCIPIVERRCPRDEPYFCYWDEVLGQNNYPFPCINSWDSLLRHFQQLSQWENKCSFWWNNYKMNLLNKLISL